MPPLSTVPFPADPVDDSPEARHRRAERLLDEAGECQDPERVRGLRSEAVLLTLDLPDRVAGHYGGRGIEHDDLVQVGRMALVKAARGYRAGLGSGFVSYAMPTISGEVKRHFRDCGWSVRPPRRLQELRTELLAEEDRLAQSLRRWPRPAEVAGVLGVESEAVVLARACGAAYTAVSLDVPHEDGPGRPEPVAAESGDIERLVRSGALRAAVGSLGDRDRRIVHLRFVEERTQAEIGAVLGVSQMQVSRLIAALLGRLRASMVEAAPAA